MRILGLILEANPFHNGHKYFIDHAKEIIKPDVTIAITTTSFTMRGDISVYDKFSKIKQLLNSNIDLVVELPINYALQSADYFSSNAIDILASLGITDLAFGVENQNIDEVINIIDLPIFDTTFQNNLKNNLSYKECFFNTILALSNSNLAGISSLPNNTLAIQYIRTCSKRYPFIKCHPIQRIVNGYYDKSSSHSSIASATFIRELLYQNKSFEDYVPYTCLDYEPINLGNAEDELFKLLKYKLLLGQNDFNKICHCSEGIDNYIKSNIIEANSYLEFIKLIKNKKYSTSRLKRVMISILLDLPIIDNFTSYIRILGFNHVGLTYINNLPDNIKNMIITTPKNVKNNLILDNELKATRLYSLINNKTHSKYNLFFNEYLLPYKETNYE